MASRIDTACGCPLAAAERNRTRTRRTRPLRAEISSAPAHRRWNARATVLGRGGLAIGALWSWVALACTHKAERRESPIQPAPSALPSPASQDTAGQAEGSSGGDGPGDPPDPLADREGVEQRLPEFESSAFRADVDGDGKLEDVAWTCAYAYSLRVGKRRAKGRANVTELQWCTAAAVPLDGAGKVPGIALCFADHDEVGPGVCVIYRVHSDRLEALWEGSARLDFYADGVITSSSSRCSEADDADIESIEILRFDGEDYAIETHEFRTPLEGAGCSEP